MRILSSVFKSRILFTCLTALLFLTVATQSFVFQFPRLMGRDSEITDFTAFHLTGQMVTEGRADEAYDWQIVRREQLRRFNDISFMPWAYPPQFTVAMGMLAALPIGLSYALFGGLTLIFFLSVLRRLCGPWSVAGLVFALPALLINARCGQNGFLTAGLIGAFLLFSGRDGKRSGLALGSMVIKPHLAAGIGVIALLERRWATMSLAVAVVIVSSVLATSILGVSIWTAFLDSTAAAGHYLRIGLYPLERMTSVYAGLRRLGVDAGMALALHGAVALAAILLLIKAHRSGCARNRLHALACMTTLLVSPYNYDYDLVVLAIVAGLLARDILERSHPLEFGGLMLLGWLATSNYYIATLRLTFSGTKVVPEQSTALNALSPYFLAMIAVWCVVILQRTTTANRSTQSHPSMADSISAMSGPHARPERDVHAV